MHRSTNFPARGVYAITDGPRRDLFAAVDAAIAGGSVIVQYRDKTEDRDRRRDEACALNESCARHNVPLIINDDIELAADVGAAGVHLGEDDGDIAIARDRLGPDAIIGVSCYDSLDRAHDAAKSGADYLAFGAFFASPTKPNARRATVELLHAAKPLGLPLVAIGGITPDNASPLIEAGADFLAVISGILAAKDIEQATRRYANLFPN
jgi:thiamine-phosphate pyrophosphorylase